MFYLQNTWFQHDGAPVHKISPVKLYLVMEFENQIIVYGGFEEWPPRSPDLFSVRLRKTASICDSSTNIAGPALRTLVPTYHPQCLNSYNVKFKRGSKCVLQLMVKSLII